MRGYDSMSQKLVSRVGIFFLAVMAVSAPSGALYAQVTKGSYTITTDATIKTAQAKTSTTSVAGPYRTLREIELRQGPGTKYPTVARLPAGIKVNVVRAEGDWLRVESKKGGKPGYVDKSDLERWQER